MTAEGQTDALIRALQQPDAYEEHPASVDMVETHISWVFFTGRHVYKVKKPVNFGFLDFSTLERRRHFCQQEVELNRRLAPTVYLGVSQVRQANGRISVDGPGETVEYAVKMRQLPRDRLMRDLLVRGELTSQHVRAVAEVAGRFHLAAARGPEVARQGGWEAVRTNVEENFAQTEPYVGRTIGPETFDEVRAYTLAFLYGRRQRFEERAAQGWVRDGHGDLHTAQVIFEGDTPQIIDCIEFNERFRYGDVASDIAFLLMDLEFHGRPDLAQEAWDAYVGVTGDTGAVEFLDFYKCYRAYVRGKVTGFLMDDPHATPEARESLRQTAMRYFRLAQTYAQAARPQPALYLAMGLSGVGKSMVAEALAGLWDMEHLSSDVVRKELAGVPATERRLEAMDTGIYSPQMSARTYAELVRRGEMHLREGRSVVLDATFLSAPRREEALAMARRLGVPAFVVHCHAPEEVVRQRLDVRLGQAGTVSDGRWEVYQAQRQTFQPPHEVPAHTLVDLDTVGTRREVLERLLRALYQRFVVAGAAA